MHPSVGPRQQFAAVFRAAPAERRRRQSPAVRTGYLWLRRCAEPVRRALAGDRGAVTAEYTVVVLAAVAFAGVLVAILRSEEIREMLVGLIEQAIGADW